MMPESAYTQAELPSGRQLTLPVQATTTTRDVARTKPKITRDVLEGVREFTEVLKTAALKCAPDGVDVALSIGFEVRSGELTALLLDANSNATLTLTLHWNASETSATDA